MIEVYKNAIHPTQKVDLEKLGLSFLSFDVGSLTGEIPTERVEGVDGEYTTGSNYNGRRIAVRLYYRKANYKEFQNGKSEVYKLLNNKQELLFVDTRLDTVKVWRAVVEDDYTLDNEQTTYTKEFEITLFSESPYAIAEENTIEIKSTDANGGIESDNTFYIYNAGDVRLDARVDKLFIKFTGVSDKLRIVNETTNTQWQDRTTTNSTDEVEIDSIYPYKNGKNIFSDTEYGVIELNTGSNKFKVYGSTDLKISFEFEAKDV